MIYILNLHQGISVSVTVMKSTESVNCASWIGVPSILHEIVICDVYPHHVVEYEIEFYCDKQFG